MAVQAGLKVAELAPEAARTNVKPEAMAMTTDPTSPSLGEVKPGTAQSPDDRGTTPEYGGPSEDPLLQAMYRVVHRYPGGVDSLAKQINRTSKYLIKAVSELPGAKLSINDALAITHITGDVEMVQTMVKMFGRKLVKLPPPTSTSDSFSVHAANSMRQLGLCISVATTSHESALQRLPAVIEICSFIQLALPHGEAAAISHNQFKELSAAFLSFDRDAFVGNPFHLQLHADLSAAFRALERKVRRRG